MTERPYRIMIVEDSETQALKLRSVLEAEHWEVVAAASAEEALQEINHRIPDMIVADYHLPGLSGVELCRQIRMNIDTRALPILMFTADETQAAQLRGLESGADDYISKSVDSDILLLRTRALLRKAQVQTSIVGPGEAYFRKARLLAIDDSPTYLEFLTEELKKEDYKVEKALSGAEGLKRIALEPFDCVLVDLVMPEMNGIAVCQQITKVRAAMDNPIVVLMLTARENKEDMTLGLEAGADDFVGKSSDMAVLKGRIRALLRRKFFQEENRRILEELKNKELEGMRAKAAQEIAETRAAMVDQLEKTGAELARSNEELEAFSYSVSHDLRAPLRHIIGFVGLLEKQAGEQLDPKSMRLLRNVSEAGNQMARLIDDLLDLSRMSRAEIRKARLNVEPMIQGIIKELEPDTEGRQILWTVDAMPEVEADSALLRQVFMNLLSNALKYSRTRERSDIHIGCQPRSNGEYVFFVSDNGVGFDMAYVNKLFGVFQRLHDAEEFDGTGIGLANVRRIIRRHGGRTWAEGVVDGGATFYFSLPKSQETK